MMLLSENVSGNLHDACVWVNKGRLAEFVIYMWSSGFNSIVVLRVPDDFNLVQWYDQHFTPKPPRAK